MPELPEVETVCRGLAPVLEGAVIDRVEVRQPRLRWPVPDDFAHKLSGRKMLTLRRRAKYMLMTMEDETVVLGHLGMSGRMTIHRAGEPLPPPGKHDHIDFVTGAGDVVRYCDPRRFGMMLLSTVSELEEHRLIRHLGPDPLGNSFNAQVLAARLRGKTGPIKAALLDQKVVAGLGNIYVCESLFRSGISPKRKAGTVQGGRADKLTVAIRDVLTEAVAAGGSTLRDHAQPDGELGYFQNNFKVYGREGEACPGCDCDVAATGGIRRLVQSGRSTFYCPRRQR